nr:hypothetical protein B0A51_14292 [Rachicladosporium sp. CCFEE 5018]
MIPQDSPLTHSGSVAFSHQSYHDGAYDPQPEYRFGEVAIDDSRMNDEFASMHGSHLEEQQQAFAAAQGDARHFKSSAFSFQQSDGGFAAYQQMLQQTADAVDAWPHGGAQPAFDLSMFQQSGGLRQSMPRGSVSAIEKYGQVTPPNDASSEAASDSKAQIASQISSEERGRNDKSERARNAAMQRHSKKKQRRGSGVSPVSGGSEDEEGSDKKEKYREKNRLAAAKCRAKKKDNIEGIEDRHRNLNAMNSALKKQVQDLRGELTDLRTRALDHQGCNCRIARYNVNQAQKVAMGTDGIGSSAGSGALGHSPDCRYGRGSESGSAGSGQGRPSAAQRHSFAAPSSFAFNGIGGPNGHGDMEMQERDEAADFAEYLQAEFGAPDGFSHAG